MPTNATPTLENELFQKYECCFSNAGMFSAEEMEIPEKDVELDV